MKKMMFIDNRVEWELGFTEGYGASPYVFGEGYFKPTYTRVFYVWRGQLFAEPVSALISWELKTPVEVERYLDNIEQIMTWAHGIRAYRGH